MLMLVNIGLIVYVLVGSDAAPPNQPKPSENISAYERPERPPHGRPADDAQRGKLPPPGHGPRGAFRFEVIDIFDLDSAQQLDFAQLAHAHNSAMTTIDQTQKSLIRSYFDVLNSERDMALADSLLELIGRSGADKIRVTQSHFEDVRNLLTEDQATHYGEFTRRAIDVLLLPRKKMPRRPKDF